MSANKYQINNPLGSYKWHDVKSEENNTCDVMILDNTIGDIWRRCSLPTTATDSSFCALHVDERKDIYTYNELAQNQFLTEENRQQTVNRTFRSSMEIIQVLQAKKKEYLERINNLQKMDISNENMKKEIERLRVALLKSNLTLSSAVSPVFKQ